MKTGKQFPVPVKAEKPNNRCNCLKCPGYCCTYSEIEAKKDGIERLAKHFELS